MKKQTEKKQKQMVGISSAPTGGQPKTTDEMVTNYGTYEIQPTADTENQYPAIAQGYNPKIKKHDCENRSKRKRICLCGYRGNVPCTGNLFYQTGN
jgi:hypothetical protein